MLLMAAMKRLHVAHERPTGGLLERDGKAGLSTIELLDHAEYAPIQPQNQLFRPYSISVFPDQQTTVKSEFGSVSRKTPYFVKPRWQRPPVRRSSDRTAGANGRSLRPGAALFSSPGMAGASAQGSSGRRACEEACPWRLGRGLGRALLEPPEEAILLAWCTAEPRPCSPSGRQRAPLLRPHRRLERHLVGSRAGAPWRDLPERHPA